MKLLRIFLTAFTLLLFVCSFSQSAGKSKKALNEKIAAKKDTVFVSYSISKQNVDSLLKIYSTSISKEDLKLFNEGEFVSSAYKLTIPLLPKGYVNDFVGMFTREEAAVLESLIAKHELETTNQIAILTIDTSWIEKNNLFEFVLKVHNFWGVGQKDKNNGIVMGICPGCRMISISNGYGIEKVLSDADTKKIIESIITPEYKKGNYFEGTKQGLLALMAAIK